MGLPSLSGFDSFRRFFFVHDLTTRPQKARLPALDRLLYLEGMNSGYGVKEAAEFLKSEAQSGEIALMVPVTLGNPVDGLMIYLWEEEKIRFLPVPGWPEKEARLIPDGGVPVYATRFSQQATARLAAADLKRTYFIYPYSFYPGKKFLEENPSFRPAWSYLKPDGINSIRIYKRDEKLDDEL